jgi:hypothetical protein
MVPGPSGKVISSSTCTERATSALSSERFWGNNKLGNDEIYTYLKFNVVLFEVSNDSRAELLDALETLLRACNVAEQVSFCQGLQT